MALLKHVRFQRRTIILYYDMVGSGADGQALPPEQADRHGARRPAGLFAVAGHVRERDPRGGDRGDLVTRHDDAASRVRADQAGFGVHTEQVEGGPAQAGSRVGPAVEEIDARLMDTRPALQGRAGARHEGRREVQEALRHACGSPGAILDTGTREFGT